MPNTKEDKHKLGSLDDFDSYFDCITACYGLEGEDFECVTECIAVHFEDEREKSPWI